MGTEPTGPMDSATDRTGQALRVGAKESFELVGGTQAWRVVQGWVDVFVLDRQTLAAGRRYHLRRVETGGVLFGAVDHPGAVLTLLAVPGNNTLIAPLALDAGSGSADALPAEAVCSWIVALTDALVPRPAPEAVRKIAGSQRVRFDQDVALVAEGAPLWLLNWPEGADYAVDLASQERGGAVPMPLVVTDKIWLRLPADREAQVQTLEDRCRAPDLADTLAVFHEVALESLGARFRREDQGDLARLSAHLSQRDQALANAVHSLAREAEDRRVSVVESIHPLFAACETVAEAAGIQFRMPLGGGDAIDASSRPLELIARASRIQCRQVRLEDQWWRRHATGPLLGSFVDGRPCALIPRFLGGYRVIDPHLRTRIRVTRELAAKIEPQATQFCEPLPDEPVTLTQLAMFCVKGTGIDLLTILVMVLVAGTLSLAPPLATREVLNSVIPAHHASQAFLVGLGVTLAAISVALLSLVQSVALLRIEGRLDLRLQTALWDRLVRSPVALFRQYSSGDLINRMGSVTTMRKLLTGSVINSLVSGIMGSFSLGLMVYYAPWLALMLAALTLFVFSLGFVLGWRLIALDRRMMTINGRIQALIVQLLGALAKLRIRGVEDIAYRRWASQFRTYQELANLNGHAYVALMAVTGTLGALALALLFTVLGVESGTLLAFFHIPTNWDQITGRPLDALMPTADFVAFVTAYVQFSTATAGLMAVGMRLTTLPPLFGRLKPLFETCTEHVGAQGSPGDIHGRVEFKNVSFHYDKDGPVILDGLSLTAEPGEFIALVGASGCGKSTALRILLGFEQDYGGFVYIDGKDLAHLDKTLVREQLGVVMQDGHLIPGTILENLTSGADVPLHRVWQAAEQAGFANDIKNMPDGLNTQVKEDGSNVSGGQRQRLLVARALIRNPRLLIMDEATSALDNETQEIVTRTVESMPVTRILVAHRLSSIKNADRIYMLAQGRVVESGSYAALLEARGAFADLVERQAES